MTNDYVRHGTTTLFAALKVLEGTVNGERFTRHRSKNFSTFCVRSTAKIRAGYDLHLIVDNYATTPPSV